MNSRVIFFALLCFTCYLQGVAGKKKNKKLDVQSYLTDPETYVKIRKSVSRGTKLAIETCKSLFRNKIWNCYVEEEKIQKWPVIMRTMLPANKEGAFLQSLGSAGVMYTLTQSCRQGKYKDCACVPIDKPPKEGQNWRWFGCNENVKFGESLAKKFVDELEKGLKDRNTLNLHNNNIGRKVVKIAARKICRCHGPTGSCQLKTCYRELLPFKRVGELLMEKYNEAIRVEFINDRLRKIGDRQRSLGKKNLDMAYFDLSPEYCEADLNTNYPGMSGRKCSTEFQNLSTCEQPCKKCRMTVMKTIKSTQEKCQCKFEWCCKVKCQLCEKKFTITTCMK